jgi:hypothetical protein
MKQDHHLDDGTERACQQIRAAFTFSRMKEEMGNFVSNCETATYYGMCGVIPDCSTVPDYDKNAAPLDGTRV